MNSATAAPCSLLFPAAVWCSMKDLILDGLSEQQKVLMAKHGTPAGFAIACYELVPGTISMDEARTAVEKYQREWDAAGDVQQSPRRWDDIPGYLGDMQ